MSSSGLGLRNIWITLRATDYTSQAFNALQKALNTTINKEKDLEKQNEALKNSSLKFLQAGMMTATLGVSLAGAIWNIASSSRQGAGDFARLNQQMFLTKQAFANTFYEMLKSTDVLTTINTILKRLETDKGLQKLVFTLLSFAAVATILIGTSFAIIGVSLALKAFSGTSFIVAIATHMMSNGFKGLTKNAITLGTALGLAFGAFTIFFTIGAMLQGPAKDIAKIFGIISAAAIGVAVAIALATGGVSALSGVAGSMAVLGMAGSLGLVAGTSFPIGTRSVPRDMNARVHKGEVIYNPSTNMPTSVGGDLGRNNQNPSVTNNYFSMPISSVHTSANYDDLENKMQKALRQGARSVR